MRMLNQENSRTVTSGSALPALCKWAITLSLLAACVLLTAVTVGCSSTCSTTDAVPLRHATLLRMERADSFVSVSVRDAWDTARVVATYVIVPRSDSMPTQHPEGTIVRTPLQRVALTASVHASLLDELGCAGSIAGITDSEFVVSPRLKSLLTTSGGTIRPLGSSAAPDLELFRAARIDALFTSPFENAGHGNLDRLDVPIIECADYMEVSPLARAEWMRFFAMLMGCEQKGDSLFAEVEKNYAQLCALTKPLTGRPTVMCDLRTASTWYQPGGGSTMGRILHDAGATYLWADRHERGSLAFDFESVFARAHDADVWILKYGADTPLTYSSLAADDERYRRFRPWRERHIWACNTFAVPFYEETPFHPERLLQNLIPILHPELNVKADRAYYTPLSSAQPSIPSGKQ